MASLLAAGGLAFLGTAAVGYFTQRNHDQADSWDPARYNISGQETGVRRNPAIRLEQVTPRSALKNGRESSERNVERNVERRSERTNTERAKPPVQLAKKESPPVELSTAAESALTSISQRFGSVTLLPKKTFNYHTREMETPDHRRLNDVPFDVNTTFEFVVGENKTILLPVDAMLSIVHAKPPVSLANTTPSEQNRAKTIKANATRLKALKGKTVKLTHIGAYKITNHGSNGDATVSPDGDALAIHKGVTVSNKHIIQLSQGDIIRLERWDNTGAKNMSMYNHMTSNRERRARGVDTDGNEHDTKNPILERIEEIDEEERKLKARRSHMKSEERNKFNVILKQEYNKTDHVQYPPNMERPDVFCHEVSRFQPRDGFVHRSGVRSKEIPATSMRSSVSLAADSHFGTGTRLKKSTDTVKARSSKADRYNLEGRRSSLEMSGVTSSRGQSHKDMSGLKTYNDQHSRAKQRKVNRLGRVDTTVSANALLRTGGRGDEIARYERSTNAKAGHHRRTSHQQRGGFTDSVVVHEMTARQGTDNNVRRKAGAYGEMYQGANSESHQDNAHLNMRLRASKPAVRLQQLVDIPGVMSSRNVMRATVHTNNYDASAVVRRQDDRKDNASRKGTWDDYGRSTNHVELRNPHAADVRTNARDLHGQNHAQEFGRQTGPVANTVNMEKENPNQRDHRVELEPHATEGRTARENARNVEQRYYDHRNDEGVARTNENTHREVIDHTEDVRGVFMRRAIDGEEPVVHPRVDASVEAGKQSMRSKNMYSEHREKDVVNLHEGTADHRAQSYQAGMATATSNIQGQEQQLAMQTVIQDHAKSNASTTTTSISNQAFINNAPHRYDGVFAGATVTTKDGTHTIGVPHEETTVDWNVDEELSARVDANMVGRIATQHEYTGINNEMVPTERNSLIMINEDVPASAMDVVSHPYTSTPPEQLSERVVCDKDACQTFVNEKIEE